MSTRDVPGSAVEAVYAALRRDIVSGEIPPGSRLNIDATARAHRVSQTPVREALQRLEGDGLLVSVPRRGYRTTPVLDRATLRALFEFRALVEPWAARRAAGGSLDNPAADLEDELARFEAISSCEDDVWQELLLHDMRFHDLIVNAAGNPVVATAYAHSHCHLHVFRLHRADRNGSSTVVEHRGIVERIRDHDADGAARSMEQHLTAAYRRSAEAFGAVTGEQGAGWTP